MFFARLRVCLCLGKRGICDCSTTPYLSPEFLDLKLFGKTIVVANHKKAWLLVLANSGSEISRPRGTHVRVVLSQPEELLGAFLRRMPFVAPTVSFGLECQIPVVS